VTRKTHKNKTWQHNHTAIAVTYPGPTVLPDLQCDEKGSRNENALEHPLRPGNGGTVQIVE